MNHVEDIEIELKGPEFEKLKKFAKLILDILHSLNCKPILWGSLAFLGYTGDKKFNVNDVDLLVPKRILKKVIVILDKKKIKYNYVPKWDCLQIFSSGLQIELDPIEYYKPFKAFQEINFNGLVLKTISLEDLTENYKKAYQDKRVAEVGPEKEEQYRKKFEALNKI